MLVVKKTIRQEVKKILQNLGSESITLQSDGVLQRLFSISEVQSSQTVCIYLSMQGEIDTYPIIKKCLECNKIVYIPKVIGNQPADMRMYRLNSFEEIDTFPKSKWGIPEPPISSLSIDEEPYLESIDVVFVPGVAFDPQGGRVGHGRGYYDCFLNRMLERRQSRNIREPLIVGLGLVEQIIESCPMEAHDRYLNCVVTSNNYFQRK